MLYIVFLMLAVALAWRFFRTGGRAMLAMMGGGPDDRSETGYDSGSGHTAAGPATS